MFNPAIDDPCAGVVSGSIVPAACNAKPNNTTSGSGTGNGSGGPAWDEVNGYPPGYDLPDASPGGFGLVLNENVWPLGKQLNRPGARLFESYDPSGVASQTGLGIYANPNLERSSAFGRGAAVTETVYAVGLEYGFVEIVYASYSEDGISLDVYYRGLRVASGVFRCVRLVWIHFNHLSSVLSSCDFRLCDFVHCIHCVFPSVCTDVVAWFYSIFSFGIY